MQTQPALFRPASRHEAVVALLPVAGMIVGMISLAIGTSFAKQLFPILGAQGTASCRVVFSAIVLVAIWRPWRFRLSRQDALPIAVYGLMLGSMNLCFYMALRTVPLGIAVAIEFIGPLLVALASSRRAADFVWIAFAIVGLGLLLPLRPEAGALDPVGIGYVLAAAVCWALYIIVGKRAGGGNGGLAVSIGMSIAALVVLPFGVAYAGTALVNPAILALGLGVAILSSVIPYSFEMAALRRLPRYTFGVLLSMEPAISAVAALAILGEHLTGVQWLAVASIIVASVGSTWSVHRARVSAGPQSALNPA